MRRSLLATVLAFLLALAACGAAPPSRGDASQPSARATVATASGSAPRSTRAVRKLLVFVVENHSLDEMRAQMPFTNGLAKRFGYADHYTAITHPSLPNYLAIAGGSTFGVRDDDSPAAHPLKGASIFGAAVRHGSTARLYADAMQRSCQTEPAGEYAVKHNPWAYFTGEAALCRRGDVPLRRFGPDVRRGRLPAVGMVIPDLCDDAHDCTLSHADGWLRTYVGRAMKGRDWKRGRLAIVITADEDDQAHGNRVLTVVAHPALHHRVVAKPLTHYSLTRAYADVAGIAPLRHARRAADLLRAFGLSPARRR